MEYNYRCIITRSTNAIKTAAVGAAAAAAAVTATTLAAAAAVVASLKIEAEKNTSYGMTFCLFARPFFDQFINALNAIQRLDRRVLRLCNPEMFDRVFANCFSSIVGTNYSFDLETCGKLSFKIFSRNYWSGFA